jgi:putative ABC transport system ATP-binding protein
VVADPVPLFALHDVVVAFGETRPLDGISVDLPGKGVTVVLGASGSGKSTMLRLLNRLEVPTSGRVLFHGEDLATLDPLALRRRVGMVFQRPTLFPGTVRDNLRVAQPAATEAQVTEAMELVGLRVALLDRVADDLSGGEAQRACLARTLITGPEVLLMDEVTSSLDPRASRVLEERTAGLADSGVPVIWVTHDLEQGLRLDPDPIVLTDGRVATEEERTAFLAGLARRPAEGAT